VGLATYHYGRWVYDSYYGWLWTPGTQWAPAWVSWREGGDYIGWAPLPPGCDFGSQGMTIYADQVIYAPNTFVFVDRRHFCEPIRPSVVIVNQTIVNKTVNITKIQRVNQVVINHGPRVDDLQHVTKRVVPFTRIHDLRADIALIPQRGYVPTPRGRPHEERVVYVPHKIPAVISAAMFRWSVNQTVHATNIRRSPSPSRTTVVMTQAGWTSITDATSLTTRRGTDAATSRLAHLALAATMAANADRFGSCRVPMASP